MADKEVQVLTESDLLKSIQALDPTTKVAPEPEPTPQVKTAALNKSLNETIKTNGSDNLRRVLDVSSALRDFSDVVGQHIGELIEPMNKSIQAGAERDLAIIKVLQSLQKSIDDNTKAIKAFGKTPLDGKTPGVTTTKADLLQKSVSSQPVEIDPARAKRLVSAGLERLVKSLPPGDSRAQEYINAAVQFEATGQISDAMMVAAKEAMTVKAA